MPQFPHLYQGQHLSVDGEAAAAALGCPTLGASPRSTKPASGSRAPFRPRPWTPARSACPPHLGQPHPGARTATEPGEEELSSSARALTPARPVSPPRERVPRPHRLQSPPRVPRGRSRRGKSPEWGAGECTKLQAGGRREFENKRRPGGRAPGAGTASLGQSAAVGGRGRRVRPGCEWGAAAAAAEGERGARAGALSSQRLAGAAAAAPQRPPDPSERLRRGPALRPRQTRDCVCANVNFPR
ncbi:hypothetical protein AAY473_024775 [Plecturocebus cupreus]